MHRYEVISDSRQRNERRVEMEAPDHDGGRAKVYEKVKKFRSLKAQGCLDGHIQIHLVL